MPLPQPAPDQKEQEFVSSCMSSEVMKKDFPDAKRRVAVCFNLFKRAKKRTESKASEPDWKDIENDKYLLF